MMKTLQLATAACVLSLGAVSASAVDVLPDNFEGDARLRAVRSVL